MATLTYTCPRCETILTAEHEKPQIAAKKLGREKNHHKKACPARQKNKERAEAVAEE